MRSIGVILVMLFASAAHAQPPGACLVERYEWHDADTPVKCVLRLPWGVLLDEPRGIRAVGYDAWEIGSRGGADVTDAERERGRKALDEIRVLSVGKSLYAVPTGRGTRDSFGRPLARLYLVRGSQVVDLAEWCRENGHCRPNANGETK